MTAAQPSPLFLGQTWPKPLTEHAIYTGGKAQCLRLATLALDLWMEDKEALPPSLIIDLLLAAWEADPLDASLAGQMLDIAARIAPLPPDMSVLLRHCAQSLEHMGLPHSLARWQEGCMAWQEEEWDLALRAFQDVGGPWLTPLERAGHCLMRLDRREEALLLWQHVLRKRPWHTALALTLHDYAEGFDQPLSGPPGPTAALLYTWNKADDLHAALKALEKSLDDLALVVCLDNGSSDATPDILRFWQDRWGERLHVHSLPVNVGAPAARNWLASLPEVRALPFAAYVDDDALVPPHWLRHLARCVRLYPHASAWGCRVADADHMTFTQSGPLHLLPHFRAAATEPHMPGQPRAAEEQDAHHTEAHVAFSPMLAKGEPFKLSDFLCAGPDFGTHAFIRPCASVTGCCHLFRTEDLCENPFSIAFSPSQGDDVHRDLLMLSQGRMACYTGFCTVGHRKRSGQGALKGATYGNGLGNKYKLHGQWEPEDIANMVRHEFQTLETDLLMKMERLEALGAL